MGNKKGIKKKQIKNPKYFIKTCSDGNICASLTNTDDVPTKVSSLGCRVLVTLILCGFVGYNIQDDRSFFSSAFMYSVPLILDYLRFQPTTKLRQFVKTCGLVISTIESVIALFGLGGIFEVISTNNTCLFRISEKFVILKGYSFDVKYIWGILAISVLITGFDWVVYKKKIEEQLPISGAATVRP